MTQGADQAVVIALVQADRGLIEHIHHAGQARADLRGQPDALRLAARQRLGRAFERQVVKADIDQKAQPVADLADDPLADHRFGARQFERFEPVAGLPERPSRYRPDRFILAAHAHPDIASLGTQA